MKVDAAEPFNTPVDPIALGIPVSILWCLFFLFKSPGTLVGFTHKYIDLKHLVESAPHKSRCRIVTSTKCLQWCSIDHFH